VPIEHPEPTQATAKSLYANAYRCGHPGCTRPLYKVDGESGIRTLNSRIAHICARREGGPRWSSTQSAEENRSFENLIVLCIEDANEVDAPGWETRFPTKLLLEWKKQQLADFDLLGRQGWVLADGDVPAALSGITITGSVNLGGFGGAAPGAGGGGGGVIGSGRAGDGGPGGWILDGRPGTAPGAGGGGGGAVGPDARGGGGGGGGEILSKWFLVEDVPEKLDVIVGEAGIQERPGCDTIVGHRLPDGTFKELFRAKGGTPGKPGHQPNTQTHHSERGPRVACCIFANCVERRPDGLFHLMGGGWTRWKSPLPENRLQAPLVLVLTDPREPVVLVFRDPIGTEAHNMRLELPDGDRSVVSLIVFIDFQVKVAGRWTVEVVSADLVIAAVPLVVELAS
jgi:hypothetical protein